MFSEIVSKSAYTTFSGMNRLESIRLLKMTVKSCCVCQLPERMNTINKYAINMMSGSGGRAQTSNIGGASDSTVTTAISPMQMHNWANFRLTGTYNTSLDGEIVQFRDITTNNLKTNLALPTEITES